MPSAAPSPVSVETSAALRAVGAVLGFDVVTTDKDEWELDAHGLRVGLGWYLQRGHTAHEAVALAALQIWEGPRDAHTSPARTRRRRALETARPDLSPLLGAVRRAQAISELLSAMPGLRASLRAAVQRSLPGDFSTLERHLQWAALVLAKQVTDPEHISINDAAVADEWRRLRALDDGDIDAIQHVLLPDPEVPPLRRFERALALLLPAYERLLALDITDHSRTVLSGNDRAELSLHSEQPLGSDDFNLGQETPDDETSEPEEPEKSADAQTGADPNPADLFASEHESFLGESLSSPIHEAGALFDAVMQLAEPENDHPESGATGIIGLGDSAAATILAEYRSRTEQLANPIDAVRALWTRILAERIAPRRTGSRQPLPAGDALATDSFATVLADTLAGVREPNAFLARVSTPRLARSAGSTDYVLMVDRSASMSGSAADAAADAALIMIEALAAVERDVSHAERAARIDLGLDIRTSLIVFASEAVVLKPLSRGLDDAVRRRMHGEVRSPSGATNDAAALRAAGDQLGVVGPGMAGPGAVASGGVQRRRIAILVSDGGSNDAAAAGRELQRLRAAGVTVHGIGVGTDDLTARYAPHGVSISDPRMIPRALERVIELELG